MQRFLFMVIMLLDLSRAWAMEPGIAIPASDPDYNYYASVVGLGKEFSAGGQLYSYADIQHFGVNGRVVAIYDGTEANPLNLVVSANGRLYYVDAILNSISSYKIRRRWIDNPEPGVFLRIEGTRRDPEDFREEAVTLWIKIATPEGRAIPSLKILEGNFDL